MATSISYAYTLYGVNIDVASDVGDTVINQIDGTPLNLGAVSGGSPNSGNLYTNCMFLQGLSPVVSVTTGNIKSALTVLGTQGLSITTDGDDLGIYVYMQKLDKFGTRASGSVHRSARFLSGMAIPRQISASRDGATMTFDIIGIDNGADPVVIAESVALPTMGTTENHYVLDMVKVGNVTLGGVTDATIDFGLNLDIDKTGGRIYPNWMHIATITPSITINGFDVDWVRLLSTDIDVEGVAATHANTNVFLKKRECGATFYADGTSNHIKFTMAGRAQPQNLLGGNGKTTASITVMGNYDGSNAPLVATLDTTIA
jgi:hypothetical protein